MTFYYSLFQGQPIITLLRKAAQSLSMLLVTGSAMAQTQSFVYTGTTQSYRVPANVTSLEVVADGAAGGTRGSGGAAPGARVTTIVPVIPGEVLSVVVGSPGSPGIEGVPVTGGYNGGGNGNGGEGGGGGATDLRRMGSSTGDALNSRNALVVAGGGGGGSRNAAGGSGGTRNGGDGQGLGGGNGATTSEPGTGPGIGQNGAGSRGGDGGTLTLNIGGGGGGGGYFGGGGGNNYLLGAAAGGGGSSWVAAGGSGFRFSLAPTGAGQLALTPQGPLPVELTAFAAQAEGPAAVRLRWSTASEHNNAGFTVERSVDGYLFTALATVAGAGTTSMAHSYSYVDKDLSSEKELFYYRLRQEDFDGTITHSPVRTITRKAAGGPAQLLAFPNPAHGDVRVQLTGTKRNTPLLIFDVQGRLVHTQSTAASSQELRLNVASLPAGFYVLRCGDLSQRLTVE